MHSNFKHWNLKENNSKQQSDNINLGHDLVPKMTRAHNHELNITIPDIIQICNKLQLQTYCCDLAITNS